jgi:hypothetical protein
MSRAADIAASTSPASIADFIRAHVEEPTDHLLPMRSAMAIAVTSSPRASRGRPWLRNNIPNTIRASASAKPDPRARAVAALSRTRSSPASWSPSIDRK